MIGVLTALSVTGTIFVAIIFLFTLMELLIPVLFVVALVAGVSLFTPYEAFVEVSVALAIVLAVVIGFLIHPRRDIYYVRTSVRRIGPDRRQDLEHDFMAVRVELVRLWLLFVPTVLSVAVLVFFRTAVERNQNAKCQSHLRLVLDPHPTQTESASFSVHISYSSVRCSFSGSTRVMDI